MEGGWKGAGVMVQWAESRILNYKFATYILNPVF